MSVLQSSGPVPIFINVSFKQVCQHCPLTGLMRVHKQLRICVATFVKANVFLIWASINVLFVRITKGTKPYCNCNLQSQQDCSIMVSKALGCYRSLVPCRTNVQFYANIFCASYCHYIFLYRFRYIFSPVKKKKQVQSTTVLLKMQNSNAQPPSCCCNVTMVRAQA